MEDQLHAEYRGDVNPLSSPASLDDAFRSVLKPIYDLLGRLEARLDQTDFGSPRDDESDADVASPLSRLALGAAGRGSGNAELLERLDEIDQTVNSISQRLGALTRKIEIQGPPLEPVRDTAPRVHQAPAQHDSLTSADASVWERIVLGDELCSDTTIAGERRQFFDEVVSGVDAARSLAGQMLQIQSTATEKIPEFLKPVGDAYYRWRPHTSPSTDPFEQALADWLNRFARKAKLPNSIELVRPGERYDSSRHIATGNGVEIVAVHGWVVLSRNGKVYTKANVSVQ